MKRFTVLVCLLTTLFASQNAQAQQEQSLNFMTDVWQSNLTNPAMLPSKKFCLALPSVYFNLSSPDFTVNDLVTTSPETGKKRIYVDSLIAGKLKQQNHLTANINVQTFGLSVAVSDNLSLTLSHSIWANPSVYLNRDLLKIFAKGNADYLGKTANIGSSGNGEIRSEFGLGAVYRLENITVGARVKLQYGIAGMFTPSNKLDVTFSSADYSMRFQNDYDTRAFQLDRFNNVTNVQDLISNGLTSSNTGISFDLGGTMKLGKLNLAASLIDLGGTINWSGGKQYTSRGDFTYKGRSQKDVDQFFNVDSLNSKSFRDTLSRVIGYTETANATYSQSLPLKIYLSGTYDVTEMLRVGGMFYMESYNGETKTGLAIDATVSLFKILHLGATFGLRNKAFNNLGAHLSAKLGPVQIFAVTDNVLTVFNPYDANNANGRAGLALVF